MTIWNDGRGYLQMWRSVFERKAPNAIAKVEQSLAPEQVRQGNSIHNFNDNVLAALTQAYEEAANQRGNGVS